jgi:toxin ParE1/3/4
MPYQVLYSRRARAHLASIQNYIAGQGSPQNASKFIADIVAKCDQLAFSPWQGTARDDVERGLRTTGFRKRITIAFRVQAETVLIAGIFYGGRNFERKV